MVVLQLVLHGPKNHQQWNNFPRIHPRFGYTYEFQSADKTCVERLVRGNRAFSFVHRWNDQKEIERRKNRTKRETKKKKKHRGNGNRYFSWTVNTIFTSVPAQRSCSAFYFYTKLKAIRRTFNTGIKRCLRGKVWIEDRGWICNEGKFVHMERVYFFRGLPLLTLRYLKLMQYI